MFSNNNLPEICFKYYCEKCDYGTSKKSSYTSHNLSAKHKTAMDINEILPKFCSEFVCKNCDKIYKDNSGLWRHSKKCGAIETQTETDVKHIDKVNGNDELINYLIKENQEFKNLILEIVKKEAL